MTRLAEYETAGTMVDAWFDAQRLGDREVRLGCINYPSTVGRRVKTMFGGGFFDFSP